MSSFTIRTPDQISSVLQAFRKSAGWTQADLAERMGVTQQTLSALERNASSMSASRLLKVLSVLGVELVFHQPDSIFKSPNSQYNASDW